MIEPRLWFGKKYYGWPLRCVPCSYFTWMRVNVPEEDLPAGLSLEITREYVRRMCGRPNVIPPDPYSPDPAPRIDPNALPTVVIEERVRRWYRDLAARFHPDKRRGSTEAMIALNVAHEEIKKVLDID